MNEPSRQHLLRHGFIRIDSTGLFAADRYVTPDQIADVSVDHVTLRQPVDFAGDIVADRSEAEAFEPPRSSWAQISLQGERL
jgi:hypothetical protein